MKSVLIIFGLILMVAGGFGFALFGLGGAVGLQLIAIAVLLVGIVLLILGKSSGNRVVRSELEVKLATNRLGKILGGAGLLFVLLAIVGFVSGPDNGSAQDIALYFFVGIILIITGLLFGRKRPKYPEVVAQDALDSNTPS